MFGTVGPYGDLTMMVPWGPYGDLTMFGTMGALWRFNYVWYHGGRVEI